MARSDNIGRIGLEKSVVEDDGRVQDISLLCPLPLLAPTRRSFVAAMDTTGISSWGSQRLPTSAGGQKSKKGYNGSDNVREGPLRAGVRAAYHGVMQDVGGSTHYT
jgi:hypothetical protein